MGRLGVISSVGQQPGPDLDEQPATEAGDPTGGARAAGEGGEGAQGGDLVLAGLRRRFGEHLVQVDIVQHGGLALLSGDYHHFDGTYCYQRSNISITPENCQ
jgi:hypothetical protein